MEPEVNNDQIVSHDNAAMCYALDGQIENAVQDISSIRPSVVLRSDVTIVNGGNGTQSNPYVIS